MSRTSQDKKKFFQIYFSPVEAFVRGSCTLFSTSMHTLIFKLVRFRNGVVALMMSMGHFVSSRPTDGNQASFTENQPFCSFPKDMRSPSVLIHLLFPYLAKTWIMALYLVNCHTNSSLHLCSMSKQWPLIPWCSKCPDLPTYCWPHLLQVIE